ncbi:uncharacterized protein P884DRAFT_263896, partial [Thermothelomyces heterothallicus CBS 202.75]|uniref:uncharacterized protein n=1 Tax=Thermothelomyces heterothallicus CBS 202.75 TaxID=1149848 RepID=UPI0037436A27
MLHSLQFNQVRAPCPLYVFLSLLFFSTPSVRSDCLLLLLRLDRFHIAVLCWVLGHRVHQEDGMRGMSRLKQSPKRCRRSTQKCGHAGHVGATLPSSQAKLIVRCRQPLPSSASFPG